jgi:lipoyl(octanoyl) transferase
MPNDRPKIHPAPVVSAPGVVDYLPTWDAMRAFTLKRTPQTPDEFWLLQHPPVYTVGLAGKPQHLPRIDNGIAVIHTDRGGQITYHGPGQILVYCLVDLRRAGLGVRELVRRMERAVVHLLLEYGVDAGGRVDAPGVYVNDAKIAALGLRIRNGCSYHGIALNVDMDLTPFLTINPCGYPGLAVTQTRDLGISDDAQTLGPKLVQHLIDQIS